MVLNAKTLLIASTAYLLLPIVIFFSTWLKPEIGIPLSLMLVASFVKSLLELKESSSGELKLKLPPIGTIIAILLLLIWTGLSGIGGAGLQTSDYIASNSMLYDLSNKPWPLVYEHPFKKGEPFYLVYYIAYYIPPAVIGYFTNWLGANIFIWFWSLIGILLSFFWFCLIVNRVLATHQRVVYASLIFMLASGADIVGHLILGDESIMEWWAGIGQYSAQTSLLIWVPQQAIPAWIGTGIVAYHAIYSPKTRLLALPSACLLLWSPLAAVGLFPFLIYTIIKNIISKGPMTVLNSENIITAPIIAVISLLYLGANTANFPINLNTHHDRFYLRYSLLLILEVLPFIAIWITGIYINKKLIMPQIIPKELNALFIIATLILIVLPFVQFGYFNDIVMRGSIPAFFIVYSVVFISLATLAMAKNKMLFWAGLCYLALGSITSLSSLWVSIKNPQWIPPNEKEVIPFTQHYLKSTVDQREGTPNSFFYRHLAKKPSF